MTEPHEWRDLRNLLDLATNRIESPHLAERAVVVARRRQAVGRGAMVAGSVALVVLVAVIGARLDRRLDSAPPAAPSTSSISSTASITSDPTTAPVSPSTENLQQGILQPKWDPRDVDALPAADDLASRLPEVVTPPESAPFLGDSPTDIAVLSVDRGSTVQLLAPDGSWRSVPAPDISAGASLSPAGSRLAIQTAKGIEVWSLSTGERRQLAFPAGFEPWDFTSTRWVDEQTLLLDDLAGGWLIDVETTSSRRVPFPTQHPYWWTLDADGALVEGADYGEPAVLRDWRSGDPEQVSMAGTGRLARPVASQSAVAGFIVEQGPIDGFAVAIADRSDLTPSAVLPVHDHEGNYSNWALGTVALGEDGTLLLWTAIPGRSATDGWRLVAWNPESGDLSVVTRATRVRCGR